MAGQHLALGLGHAVELLRCPGIQFTQGLLVVEQALAVVEAALGVGNDQGAGHVLGVALHDCGVGPDVGINVTVVVTMVMALVVVVILLHLDGGNALAGRQAVDLAVAHGALDAGTFKAQSVHQHHLGSANLLDIGRLGLVDMRVLIGADQRFHLDALAPDGTRHIAQNAETGHHRHRCGGEGLAGSQGAGGKQRLEETGHEASFRSGVKPARWWCRCESQRGIMPPWLAKSSENRYTPPQSRMMAGPDGRSTWKDSSKPP